MATRTPRTPAPRYGIAEWFGKDIRTLSAADRKKLGRLSYAQAYDAQKMSAQDRSAFWLREFGEAYVEGDMDARECPSLSSLAPRSLCNKSGGVCSMRQYDSRNGIGQPVLVDRPPTVCPLRFLESGTVLRWVAEKMLGTRTPMIVKETPFLRKISSLAETTDTDETDTNENKRAGRIDWILIDPASVETDALKWCALETQGVYFSGDKWDGEFKAYATSGDQLYYPIGRRRPDYRSNGPKRLAPQLSVKVPVLRAWGTKVAVVVDEYFFNQMAELKPAFSRARNEQDHLDRAEVVWFIVRYDENMNMVPASVYYSDLDKSVDALNATEPIERTLFQTNLRALIQDPARAGSKVFNLRHE